MEVKFTPIIQDGTILEKWNNSPHFFSSRARMIWSSQNIEIKNRYDLSIPDKKEEYKVVSLIINVGCLPKAFVWEAFTLDHEDRL